MKLSLMGRMAMATMASLALGLGMTACGGGTVAFLWVLGDQYNQITGFKVDNYTGNLTQIPGSPFTSSGANPVSIVVKPGGRYVYVINQGIGGSGPTGTPTSPVFHKETSGGVAVYSVGGDGVLTFQQSYQTQGSSPQWAQFDGSGQYLYVVDKYTADAKQATNAAGATYTGSITAFAVDGSTGRLTLVTNQQVKDASGVPTTFFNVGVGPKMIRSIGGCLFTLDSDNTIFPYSFSSNGQLTLTTNLNGIATGASSISSINGNGSLVILTDQGANRILPYTVGSGCNLSTLTGGGQPNITGTSNPVYSFIDNSGKYLYVLNQTTTSTTVGTPFSSISAFTLNASTQQLQQIAGSPYPVGSGPVCVVEDPTNQYLYISNRNDGTVTGKVIDSTTGELSNLSRGSTFPASGLGSCLAISGAVN